jgi:hypothetical protein
MSQKWNLQDIRPADPKRRRPSQNSSSSTDTSTNLNLANRPVNPTSEVRNSDPVDTLIITDGNKKSRKNTVVLALVLILFIGGIFGVSFFVTKTTLTIYPEVNTPVVNAQFVAYPERREGELSYEIMSLSDNGEIQVTATGQETVTEQAKGFIEIIKTTPGTERLIKNTRFRSPDGKIFKIQESVVVPGAIKGPTGTLVPGTIRTAVFADQSGEEYNLTAETKFDVPGFKDSNLTELYNAIYAVNREPFTGGFNGPRFIIDEQELAKKQQELQITLRDKLLAKLSTENPADFIAFPGAVAITYNSLPAVQHDGNLVIIREEAVLQIPLFKHDELAGYIAEETIPTYEREPVRMTNAKDLIFAYTIATTSSSNIANAAALEFTLLGKPEIVHNFDANQLRTDLAGKPLTAITTVLTGHTGIEKAEISGKPFWRRTFPENVKEIEIIEVLEQK